MKTKLNNKEIIEILIDAKQRYLTYPPYYQGMCHAIKNSINDLYKYRVEYSSELQGFIPLFKPATFGLSSNTSGYWWEWGDTISRRKAFDKLIKIYTKKYDEENNISNSMFSRIGVVFKRLFRKHICVLN